MIQIKDGHVGNVRMLANMSFNECIGMSIRAIRLSQGYSQVDVGIFIDVLSSQANKLESGKSIINAVQLYTIAQKLNVSPNDIFELAEKIYNKTNKL